MSIITNFSSIALAVGVFISELYTRGYTCEPIFASDLARSEGHHQLNVTFLQEAVSKTGRLPYILYLITLILSSFLLTAIIIIKNIVNDRLRNQPVLGALQTDLTPKTVVTLQDASSTVDETSEEKNTAIGIDNEEPVAAIKSESVDEIRVCEESEIYFEDPQEQINDNSRHKSRLDVKVQIPNLNLSEKPESRKLFIEKEHDFITEISASKSKKIKENIRASKSPCLIPTSRGNQVRISRDNRTKLTSNDGRKNWSSSTEGLERVGSTIAVNDVGHYHPRITLNRSRSEGMLMDPFCKSKVIESNELNTKDQKLITGKQWRHFPGRNQVSCQQETISNQKGSLQIKISSLFWAFMRFKIFYFTMSA